jgi:hypothetical protein
VLLGSQLAVHRTVLAVDVESFGDLRRSNANQVAVRRGLYRALRHAFHDAGMSWTDCWHEDRGDGVLTLGPAQMPKAPFVEALPYTLVKSLRQHNMTHRAEERIRLRVALHAGEVIYDEHGVTATCINLTCRLLEAEPLKLALANSSSELAMITSTWFFTEVVRQSRFAEATQYSPVRIAVKETSTVAWIYLPDTTCCSIRGTPVGGLVSARCRRCIASRDEQWPRGIGRHHAR